MFSATLARGVAKGGTNHGKEQMRSARTATSPSQVPRPTADSDGGNVERGGDGLGWGWHHAVENDSENAGILERPRAIQITVAIDGTKILANASKHGAVSHGHALEQMKLLEDQIAELLAKAEDADSTPLQDGLSIAAEIARREERIGKLREATAVIEARAAERCQKEIQEQQLIPALGSISPEAGKIGTALVDSGYLQRRLGHPCEKRRRPADTRRHGAQKTRLAYNIKRLYHIDRAAKSR